MSAQSLTPEQRLLLTAVAHGVSHQQLATERGISRPAVSKALHRARLRLGAATVTHAVHLATRAGLIPDAVSSGSQSPMDASGAPGPRPSAAGASGGDVAGFNGGARASSRAGDSRSDPRRAEAGPRGTCPGLAASGGPVPASSPHAAATATEGPREVTP